MLPQIIIAANAFALDEGLGCGFDIMLVFERVCLGAARQPIILDVEPFALEQVQGLETKGTDMTSISLITGTPEYGEPAAGINQSEPGSSLIPSKSIIPL